MINLNSDYTAGAHERILKVIVDSNMERTDGYGEDNYSREAREIIKSKLGNPKCDIYFTAGGTMTNLTVISHILRPHQAAIACDTGHINVHETGAIEATGHKVITVKSDDFKLKVKDIEKILEVHEDHHMVQPKLVYISNPTELGTIYSKKELQDLKKICEKENLFLFLDGARMASALTSEVNDVEFSDYAKYTDVFYIGGTKCGMLFGEAVILLNDKIKEDFNFSIKQRGALFAKGRLLGIQFKEMFKDNLYFEIGEDANKLAKKIREKLTELGVKFFSESYTNQIFAILKDEQVELLSKKVIFTFWEKYDNERTIVRFVTSWINTEEEVDTFLTELEKIF